MDPLFDKRTPKPLTESELRAAEIKHEPEPETTIDKPASLLTPAEKDGIRNYLYWMWRFTKFPILLIVVIIICTIIVPGGSENSGAENVTHVLQSIMNSLTGIDK